MNVNLIGKHEKDPRACRDALALTLNEMMAEDKSIVYVDC
ncbi:MAG: transketolase family protein, partial [Ruminococcaceae bacterium]|nr:transketolase family protein [Oscillospiraceae bacterium]